ncbi:hypothetical protein ACFYXC_10030, partial [Streptomyces sp. NPDC002701]|uniref:hypothetical protein n=1 Tax=Streptomyces sp. NPDC002701 TaxID=3364661 RepID=UPI0036BFECA9
RPADDQRGRPAQTTDAVDHGPPCTTDRPRDPHAARACPVRGAGNCATSHDDPQTTNAVDQRRRPTRSTTGRRAQPTARGIRFAGGIYFARSKSIAL